ncbi:unnamed protein product [Durusdinium trenchii]|uniref:ANK_REP_REGION domain-containing protein n=1 Tax=Durusdinium trenchii TaxID=1381693 RepID=A0ABP0N5N7_9DINO
MAEVQLPESLKVDDNFGAEIRRLSKEWRTKRESYRTNMPLTDPEEQLVSAATSGDLKRCRALLNRKAAAPDATSAGQTALFAAAAAGKAESVALLLAAGASPSISSTNGATPLHVAAEQSYGKICLALLEGRADPNCRDGRGLTPAALASSNEALWPLFSAAGCERVQQAMPLQSNSPDTTVCSTRPSSATSTTQRGTPPSMTHARTARTSQVNPIDILAAETSSVDLSSAASSFRLQSLGL